MGDMLITSKQAAEILDIPKEDFDYWVRIGLIDPVKKRWLFVLLFSHTGVQQLRAVQEREPEALQQRIQDLALLRKMYDLLP